MKKNQNLLTTVFIVSDLQVEQNARKDENKIGVKVEVAEGEKCERCWKYSTTVGENKKFPTLCNKCSEVMEE